MSARRPFSDTLQLLAAADEIWWGLRNDDWLEAFASHPQIGGNGSAHRWSSQEQSGVQTAADETRRALALGNQRYLEKFGFIYIVCATGKSAEEMLQLLNQRISNDRETEIRIAAEEQSKITKLRLRKLLDT
jgi:OHCU decarboxylase